MATYLDGVHDGRQDVLIRIEREAVAVFRDSLTDPTIHRHPKMVAEARTKLSTMVGLIKQLSDQPVAWLTVYERIESEALRQITQEREAEKLAAAKAVS